MTKKKEPPQELVRDAFTGENIAAIVDFCYELLADIELRCYLESTKETHIVSSGRCYSPAQINHYIFMLIKQCYAAQLVPPLVLVELISAHFSQDLKIDKKTKEWGRGKKWARRKAIEYKKQNPNASDREIAKAVGVHHTSIGRWGF